MTVCAFKSVDFVSEKGVATEKSLPPVKVFLFFCEIRSSHIFPAVSAQRGLTSIVIIVVMINLIMVSKGLMNH